jgi:hypothetical protein
LALIDRGGKAFGATIHYPEKSSYTEATVVTPNFDDKRFSLSVEDTNRLLGLKLNATEIGDLLLKAGLGVESISDEGLEVLVPCYRVDVMHQVDIIEDVAIAYGYNNIEPIWRELATTGRAKHHPNQPGISLQKNEHPVNQNHRVVQPENSNHDLPAELAPTQPYRVSKYQPVHRVPPENLRIG